MSKKQVTQGHNTVAYGWVGAFNSHSHPMLPPPTHIPKKYLKRSIFHFLTHKLRTNVWTDRRTDGWTDSLTEGRMDRQADGQTDGWTDGWTDGQTEGWMDQPTDGQTKPLIKLRVCD